MGNPVCERTECVLEKCHDFQAFNSLALLKMKKKFYKTANIIFDMPELGDFIDFFSRIIPLRFSYIDSKSKTVYFSRK